jgi:hypothetical protein
MKTPLNQKNREQIATEIGQRRAPVRSLIRHSSNRYERRRIRERLRHADWSLELED